MHVPVAIAERARDAAAEHRVDVLVSVGGGSTTGLAKAVALTTGLPIDRGAHHLRRLRGHQRVGPDRGLDQDDRSGRAGPAAHRRLRRSADDLAAGRPERRLRAERAGALRRLDVGPAGRPDRPGPGRRRASGPSRRACPASSPTRRDLEGREQALYGAYLAAVAFASAGSGLHHKICHVLGGMLQPAARPDPRRRPALRARAQRAGRARGRGAHRRAPSASSDAPRRPARTCATGSTPPAPCATSGSTEYGSSDAAVEAILPAVPPSNPTDRSPRRCSSDLLRRAWEGAEPR